VSTEDQIRDLFAADAAAAPAATGLLDGTMRRVRRRRRQQAAWVAAGCVGALAAAVVVAPGLTRSEPVVIAGPASSASSVAPPAPVGTVPPGVAGQPLSVPFSAGTAACAMIPGAERFALDGAVVAVAPSPAGDIRLAGRPLSVGGSRVADVTVHVNEWLVGGDPASDTVVLRMTAPGKGGADGIGSAALPRYEVGTRLLISGRLLGGAEVVAGGVQGLATNMYECESGAFYYSAPLAEAWADGVLPYNAWISVYGDAAGRTETAAP
jgi:hypothetical protein